jgi:cytochrome c553
MTTRLVTSTMIAAACAAMTLGCSSSSSNNKDAGTDTKADAPKDLATEHAGEAGPGDGGSPDTAAPDASDGGAVLTAIQARGQYLVDHVIACGDCHTPRTAAGAPDVTKYLAGNAMFIVTPGGNLGTRNLTNDETGLKNKTDAEIKDLFTNGKRPAAEGGFLNPIMPYYVFHNMKTEDADAIVAYLRVVPGVNNPIPKRAAAFDVTAAATPLDPNAIPLPDPTYAQRESALRGRYLTSEIGLCIECHTKHVMTATVLDTAKFFQGGEDFSAFFGGTLHPVSKNLTSDPTTGLGAWTTADIITVLKMGKAKDGTGICPPMPVGPMGAYGGLKDEDAADIANFIKSLPAAVNLVPDMCVFPPPMPDGGVDGAEGGTGDGGTGDGATDGAGDGG